MMNALKTKKRLFPILLILSMFFTFFISVPISHAAGVPFPFKVAAPYVQIDAGTVPSISGTASSTGNKFYTLAFILGPNCQATWGGTGNSISSNFMIDEINNLRNQGGDVIISFGGAGGDQELGITCGSVAALQAQYQAVIDKTGAKWLDFDIEGDNIVNNTTANTRRSQAIANLQQANSGLHISYTLAVNPSGLPANILAVVTNAKNNGVNVGEVNIMAMDYGTSLDMGQAAIDAANSTYTQLKNAGLSSTLVGITPMIGVNDSSNETFTLNNATTVLNFAKQNSWVGRLAFWSLNRDNGGCAGNPVAQGTCSGISQSNFQFTNIFNAYNPYVAPIPGKIEAENYMVTSGTQTETTLDTGGGFDVGHINPGSTMDYNVNIQNSGIYNVDFRVASINTTGQFQLKNASGAVLTTITVPNTGGWQTWQTVSANVNLTAGNQTLKIYAVVGGFNINWLNFASNLALNKPATASSTESISYGAGLAVDGSGSTRWSSSFSDSQWIYVDLGQSYTINHVRLNWEAAYGKSYTIQVADNAAGPWTNIYSTTAGDGGIDDLTGLTGNGRYVRMNGTQRGTTYGYSLWEFEIYGVASPNLVNNPSFESGSSVNWTEWHGQGLAQQVDTDTPRTGSFKLTHFNSAAYTQITSQILAVPNGTYKLSAWFRSGGGQNVLRLYAKNYGSTELQSNLGGSVVTAWTQYVIDNIIVTNGNIEFGIYSDSNANNWAAIDDFELIKK